MEFNNKPKPDDRSDNVDKLQVMISNTIENIEAAEESMQLTNGKAREEIEAKNDRRREALQGFRSEIKDEATAAGQGANEQENRFE